MKENLISEEELSYRQSLPLSIKQGLSVDAIRAFLREYSSSGTYISFSGGKDSTVLADLVWQIDASVPAVFLDTWMEFPQLRRFVHQFSEGHELIVIKPEKTMKQIIDECGWCFPSKDVAEAVDAYRRNQPWAIRKLHGLDKDGKPSEYRKQYTKWLKLAEECPLKISQNCCIEMKEKPAMSFETKTARKPILGLMAVESARRKRSYMQTGCNAFDCDRPVCKPLGFWTEQDILHQIVSRNLQIAPPYGEIMRDDDFFGQMMLFEDDLTRCKLCTSGESRTGCMFCPVGGHLDHFAKIRRLQTYDIRLYDYVMEELNLKALIEWVEQNY